MQSTRGLGALNKGVEDAAGRFMSTLFPEIDDLRYHLVTVSDFEFSSIQGTAVAVVEAGFAPTVPEAGAAVLDDDEALAALVRRLAAGLERGSVEDVLELFDEQAMLTDVEGSRPYRGKGEIAGYLGARIRAIPAIQHQLGPVAREGVFARVAWSATGSGFNGAALELAGEWELTLTEGGRIRTLLWRWDPAIITDQVGAGAWSWQPMAAGGGSAPGPRCGRRRDGAHPRPQPDDAASSTTPLTSTTRPNASAI